MKLANNSNRQHVVTTVFDPDGACETLPPEDVATAEDLDRPGVQETFDTEKEAMASYAEQKPDPKILFVADCHMKRRTWTNSTLLQGDATAALSTVITNAMAIGSDPVRTMVVGGDMFDNNRPSSQDLWDVSRLLAMFYV